MTCIVFCYNFDCSWWHLYIELNHSTTFVSTTPHLDPSQEFLMSPHSNNSRCPTELGSYGYTDRLRHVIEMGVRTFFWSAHSLTRSLARPEGAWGWVALAFLVSKTSASLGKALQSLDSVFGCLSYVMSAIRAILIGRRSPHWQNMALFLYTVAGSRLLIPFVVQGEANDVRHMVRK